MRVFEIRISKFLNIQVLKYSNFEILSEVHLKFNKFKSPILIANTTLQFSLWNSYYEQNYISVFS